MNRFYEAFPDVLIFNKRWLNEFGMHVILITILHAGGSGMQF